MSRTVRQRAAPGVHTRGQQRLVTIIAFAPLVGLLVTHALAYHWLCDDAYISFRYARNLLDGHGLVFNRGEPVEGYTNFLWILNLALLWLAGLEPQTGAYVLSGLYTAATCLACYGFARNSPPAEHRAWIFWCVLLLLAINRTFAVWSTSGLETRQFTFFVLISILILSRYKSWPRAPLYAGLTLALAEFSRPEGLLIGGLCGFWYVADAAANRRLTLRGVLQLALPFTLLVAAHFAFRLWYYGDLLPNTYYAKHVQPWPDGGLAYLVRAAIENGLYVLLPLALLGAYARLAAARDSVHLLSLLCIFTHMAYLMRIGGDHFEYRPLDFYWPLLTITAVEGVFWLVAHAVRLARWSDDAGRVIALRFTALGGVAIVALYCTVLQIGHYCLTYDRRLDEPDALLSRGITRENYPAAFLVPLVETLIPTYNETCKRTLRQGVGATQREFALNWRRWRAQWAPYEALRGTNQLPPDAVACAGAAGIMPYFLSELTVIDTLGLNDREIARQKVNVRNQYRTIAHDKRADSAYLRRRGVNTDIFPAARRLEDTAHAAFAMPIRDDLWMPFAVRDEAWAARAFAGKGVLRWTHETTVGHFDDGTAPGWTLRGDALAANPRPVSAAYLSVFGAGFLSTWHPQRGDDATGEAISPTFEAAAGRFLYFRVGGGAGDDVGVELRSGDDCLGVWRGKDTETLDTVVLDLTPLAGRSLQLRAFDAATDAWGHILLDHVTIMRATPAFP